MSASTAQFGTDTGTPAHYESVSVVDLLWSLASFMIGTVVIVEAVAYWGFRTQAGLWAVVIPASVSILLVIGFRDKLKSS